MPFCRMRLLQPRSSDMIASTKDSITLSLHGTWDQAFAEEEFLLAVDVHRSANHASAVLLHSISSEDRDIILDTTLFQSGIQVLPGETYRFVLPMTVACP